MAIVLSQIATQHKRVVGIVRYDDPTIFIHIRHCNDCTEYYIIKNFNYQVTGKIRKRTCKICQQTKQRRARRRKRQKLLADMVSMKW